MDVRILQSRDACLKPNEAVLARIEEIGSSSQARPETIDRLRSDYVDRIRQLRREASHEGSVRWLYLAGV